jgi:hypothetical protein
MNMLEHVDGRDVIVLSRIPARRVQMVRQATFHRWSLVNRNPLRRLQGLTRPAQLQAHGHLMKRYVGRPEDHSVLIRVRLC